VNPPEGSYTVNAGPVGPLSDVRRGRWSREQRRNLRSAAFDLLAVVAALALVGLGLANLHLIGETELAVRQAMIAAAGVLALALFWRVRVRYLGVLGWVAYGAAVLLLIGVLTVGLSANGATRWIAIGPLSFQPSELAKLGLLLVLAGILASSRPAWQRFALAVLLAIVPIGLTLLQPDLSTTTLLVVLAGTLLVIARAVPAAAGRRGRDLGAAADRSPAALSARAARHLPGRRARVPDRLGLGGAAGAHRGRFRGAVRADR
jgi:hypothetical protein